MQHYNYAEGTLTWSNFRWSATVQFPPQRVNPSRYCRGQCDVAARGRRTKLRHTRSLVDLNLPLSSRASQDLSAPRALLLWLPPLQLKVRQGVLRVLPAACYQLADQSLQVAADQSKLKLCLLSFLDKLPHTGSNTASALGNGSFCTCTAAALSTPSKRCLAGSLAVQLLKELLLQALLQL